MIPKPIKVALCNQCGCTKPVEEFAPNPLKRNGRKAMCRSCAEKSRERSRAAREARLNSLVEAA